MAKKPVPAIDLLLPSIEIIKQHVALYFLFAVVPMLLVIYGTASATTITELLTSPYIALGWLLTVVFYAPLTYTLTRTAGGQRVALAEALQKGYRYFLRLIGLNLIVGLLVTLGFICFIVPGFILLKRFYLASFLLVDKNVGIMDALRRASALSATHGWAIYSVIFVSLLFGLFGIVPGIGTALGLILQFLYSVAPPLRYHELKKLKA